MGMRQSSIAREGRAVGRAMSRAIGRAVGRQRGRAKLAWQSKMCLAESCSK
jgi:hypothetical protein